jgi:hypothetical protein
VPASAAGVSPPVLTGWLPIASDQRPYPQKPPRYLLGAFPGSGPVSGIEMICQERGVSSKCGLAACGAGAFVGDGKVGGGKVA